MSFQFTCPQGHLLEGDPAYAGMQSQCPTCGTLFVIPQPQEPAPGQTEEASASEAEPPPEPATEPQAKSPEAPEAQDDPDRIVHILCPNGHELETPMSMVGSDAMCPHCSAEFHLRHEDSREYREEKAKQRELREANFDRKALQWAIVAAALVILGLLWLIVASSI
jgi:uncharacterized Zn finger protein (UPF0148 family)